MSRLLRRLGWARSIGAGLTLVGVAVVFLVVILPTVAFGSSSKSKAAKGGCKIGFKSFTTDKKARLDEDANTAEESAGNVAIFGEHLNYVDDVQFKADTGSKIEYVSASSWSYASTGWIVAAPDPDSLGVPGKIKLIDTGPDPDCVVYSGATYTPAHVS